MTGMTSFERQLKTDFRRDGHLFHFVRRVSRAWYVFTRTNAAGSVHIELVTPIKNAADARYPSGEEFGRYGFALSGPVPAMLGRIRELLGGRAADRDASLPDEIEFKWVAVEPVGGDL